jgi:urate oxidase/2-oxo-4-hydroxy-4-carboxy-5-ureidoimidazoline decarboxylase
MSAMLEPINGRTIFYGKSDVLTYRTYARPLRVAPVPESSFTGCDNIIFAHNITFAVTGEAFLPSFTEEDNSMVVATDSMKKFIQRNTVDYTGNTTEGLLQLLSSRFIDKYSHVAAISVTADRLPFKRVMVPGKGSLTQSLVVLRQSNNRTRETIVEPEEGKGGVFTELRPPYGFQGSMSRADLAGETPQ